jgi:hypothetical protein
MELLEFCGCKGALPWLRIGAGLFIIYSLKLTDYLTGVSLLTCNALVIMLYGNIMTLRILFNKLKINNNMCFNIQYSCDFAALVNCRLSSEPNIQWIAIPVKYT